MYKIFGTQKVELKFLARDSKTDSYTGFKIGSYLRVEKYFNLNVKSRKRPQTVTKTLKLHWYKRSVLMNYALQSFCCRLFTTIKILVALLSADLKLEMKNWSPTRKEKASEFWNRILLLL